MRTLHICSIGLAVFTLLFGAGNVVFPLGLGRDTGTMAGFALLGLLLTGIVVPLLGLVSSALFEGDYKKFFSMAGTLPGALLALICILLIGPLGAIPRCLNVAYAAVAWHIPQLSIFIFSIFISGITFAATIKKGYVVDLFGRLLGPIKITLLLSIIVLGFLFHATPISVTLTPTQSFFLGCQEGYMMLDLLATIFFSGLIVASIRTHRKDDGTQYTAQEIANIALKAGAIGGLLLGTVYSGFCLLSAKLSSYTQNNSTEQILSSLATLVLGERANILANAAMALACLTTAIALTAVVADYITHELFWGKIKYTHALLITISLNLAMTNLGFSGISQVIEPLAILCYPSLIMLSITNIAHILWDFRHVKFATLTTLGITIITHLLFGI